jgi:uncharacterized protein (TIGR03435 family)
MADLAGMREPFTEQRTVRDRTGLTGRYHVQLTWTPDRLGPVPPNAPEEVMRAREAIDPNGAAFGLRYGNSWGSGSNRRKTTLMCSSSLG